MDKDKKLKKPKQLPLDKYQELPDSVVYGQILEIFKEEIKENYSVEYLQRIGDGKWLVKLNLIPGYGAFKYSKERAKDEEDED